MGIPHQEGGVAQAVGSGEAEGQWSIIQGATGRHCRLGNAAGHAKKWVCHLEKWDRSFKMIFKKC